METTIFISIAALLIVLFGLILWVNNQRRADIDAWHEVLSFKLKVIEDAFHSEMNYTSEIRSKMQLDIIEIKDKIKPKEAEITIERLHKIESQLKPQEPAGQIQICGLKLDGLRNESNSDKMFKQSHVASFLPANFATYDFLSHVLKAEGIDSFIVQKTKLTFRVKIKDVILVNRGNFIDMYYYQTGWDVYEKDCQCIDKIDVTNASSKRYEFICRQCGKHSKGYKIDRGK